MATSVSASTSSKSHTSASTASRGSSFAHSGYTENIFDGKQEQMINVVKHISDKGFIPKELVSSEVQWFYTNLGIDDMYFMLESVESIANHIMALYGAKIHAFIRNESVLDINLERETDAGAVYIHTSRPGVSSPTGPQVERRIDNNYLDNSAMDKAYRLETYRSLGTVSTHLATQLRCYFVAQCQFIKPFPTEDEATDIRLVADKTFLEKATENTLDVYQNIMQAVLERTGPVIEMYQVKAPVKNG